LNNLFNLSGKVFVVTGACGLLGRSHCDAIARVGGIPVVLDLDQLQTENLASEISQKYSVECKGFSVDITNEEQIAENANSLTSIFGKIDGLVNNAANNPKVENSDDKNFSRLENFPLDVWHNDLSVGLTGAFLCCKHYGTKISQNSNGGVILNISSDLGLIAPDQNLYRDDLLSDDYQPVKPVTYSVIKSGLLGLTRYMATYWPEKVRCNALCPGGVEVGQSEEFLNKIKEKIPMKRMARVNDYQGSLIYMLSEASSYMNGSLVSVDGGRTVW
jgi:NAD(P)-dependent dehydrogenase (short-subunit alcohol dehydrogenase family)